MKTYESHTRDVCAVRDAVDMGRAWSWASSGNYGLENNLKPRKAVGKISIFAMSSSARCRGPPRWPWKWAMARLPRQGTRRPAAICEPRPARCSESKSGFRREARMGQPPCGASTMVALRLTGMQEQREHMCPRPVGRRYGRRGIGLYRLKAFAACRRGPHPGGRSGGRRQHAVKEHDAASQTTSAPAKWRRR